MALKLRHPLFAFALAVVLAGPMAARGQQPLPPAPIPAVPSGAGSSATVIAPPLIPAQTPEPPLPPPSVVPPPNPGPMLVPVAPVAPSSPVANSPPILMPPPPPEPLPAPPLTDHWADRPASPPPGWFGTIEIDLVGPHIKNRL